MKADIELTVYFGLLDLALWICARSQNQWSQYSYIFK